MPLTTEQLMAVQHAEQLSKKERWSLIDQIDRQIDHLQQCQQVLHQNRLNCHPLNEELKQLRLKRFQIWNTFYPQYRNINIARVDGPAQA